MSAEKEGQTQTKFGRDPFSPGAYHLDLSIAENLPLTVNGQQSTFGELYRRLLNSNLVGTNDEFSFSDEYTTDTGECFRLDGKIGEWPLRHTIRGLVSLMRQHINPYSVTWFYYDRDYSRDADECLCFFAVHQDKIVNDSWSFNSEEPLILKQQSKDHEPIWNSHEYFQKALPAYWYRRFYRETLTGQLMVLRSDEPVLYFYNRPPLPSSPAESKKEAVSETGWKTYLPTFVFAVLVGFYTAFVLTILWGWFVVPIFSVKELGFWQALGLVWTAQLFLSYLKDDGPRWKALAATIECCVPEEKKEELSQILRTQSKEMWTTILEKAAGITFTLGLGWLVHTFLV